MKNIKPILLLALCIPVLSSARECRKVGSFEIGRHPVILSIDSMAAKTRRLSVREKKSTIKILAHIKNQRALQAELAPYHWEILSNSSGVATLRGPVQSAPYLKAFADIIAIETNLPFAFPATTMDSARSKTGVDFVLGRRPLIAPLPRTFSGKGVLIGMIDTEFDTRHKAFLDSAGHTRFVAVWDQGDTSIAHQNRYGFGVIKNHSQLLTDTNFGLGSNGHGTLMTSYAAGGDTALPYYGAAIHSPIIAVKYTSDITANVVHGLRWISSMADSLNMPCVINMSIGLSYGPHDGTSLVDRTIDSLALSRAGLIIVGAAGNDHNLKTHITFAVARNEVRRTWCTSLSHAVSVSPPDTHATAAIDIWGEANRTLKAGFDILDATTMTYKSSGDSILSTSAQPFLPDTVFWTDSISGRKDTLVFYLASESANFYNGKSHIQAVMTTTNPALILGVRLSTTNSSGTIHAWNMQKKGFESYGISGYEAGDSNYTINEIGGTANNIIAVGGYVSKARVYTWNNIVRDEFDSSTIGMLSHFSSFGPTVDGRIKPDITAPANMVVGAMSRSTAEIGQTMVWPDTLSIANRYCYGIGTSVSSPIVAGIVALMLEVRPTLTPDSVKYYLKQSAIQDVFTGTIISGNNKWGMGKVNALGAMCKVLGIAQPTDINTITRIDSDQSFIKIKRINNSLSLVGPLNDRKKYQVSLFDLAGRMRFAREAVAGEKIILPPAMAQGTYVVSVKDNRQTISRLKLTQSFH